MIKDNSYYSLIFEECYTGNFHKIRSFVQGYLHDYDSAKCVAQETFVVLWENKERVNFNENLLPYLFFIAKNKSLNILNKKESQRKYCNYSLEHTRETLDISALTHSSSTSVYTKEIQQITLETMNRLPAKVRETFLLCREKNMKYNEIAMEQNISVKTVEYRISMALRELRKDLKDYLPFFIGYLLSILFTNWIDII
ncbi:MAG: RNA polymerase sigma-70 factor [Bacteroidales bacterium]